ncbi:hypothetical protein [Campylobacter sp. 19-13652]|uniref:hypothetical protein n=1 Tax=Campylobacter sp. 19-13652 TaxID=2840180 RepID=UPI001C765425|nr:hypothetical protein [Campylobacter sp. 19-13652]BCX78740.1 hypothetical protein LBC_02020 [Campylobacter sp. 19-13652]
MRKILYLALFCIALNAKTMYIYDEKVTLLEPNSKKSVGIAYEGTPVELISNDGKMATIKINGFLNKDNKSILSLSKDGFVSLLKLYNTTPSQSGIYLVPSDKLTANKDEAWDEVKLYYYDTCSTCHAAHKPKEHQANEWEAYIAAMQDFAKIDDENLARIVRFMQAFASDGDLR